MTTLCREAGLRDFRDSVFMTILVMFFRDLLFVILCLMSSFCHDFCSLFCFSDYFCHDFFLLDVFVFFCALFLDCLFVFF